MNFLKIVVGLAIAFGVSARAAESDGPFSFYGFLLPTIIGTSGAVETFSQPNASAYTAAGNPFLAASPAQARTSFQVAQSRFGFLVKPIPEADGRLEFDIIDFSKASPTTAALPRIRRAYVDYRAAEGILLRFGQDWDLTSPLAPFSYNYVGHYFQSGDIAFMRLQLQALVSHGALEHGLALGLPGSNNLASDQLLELGLMPTLALRETYRFTGGQVGASAIGTLLRKEKTTSETLFSGAATAFLEIQPWSGLQLRWEAYFGQNTFNIGLLGVGFGNAAAPRTKETGSYLSFRQAMGEQSALFGGVGGSWVLEPGAMLPSYTVSGAGVYSLAGTGPGLERNFTVRLGYEHRLAKVLVVFVEAAGLFSRHHYAAGDAGKASPDQTAFVGQTGAQLSF